MADQDPKTTDVDLHLAVERTPSGGAHVLADWSVRIPGTSFNINIETITGHSVPEAIAFMSDLQKMMVDSMRTYGAVHGVTLR